MNQRQINIHVDRWIEEDDLPVRASLKVIHRNDPDYEMTEDEIEDRKEFIRCYILKDFATLLMIPVQKFGSEFCITYPFNVSEKILFTLFNFYNKSNGTIIIII